MLDGKIEIYDYFDKPSRRHLAVSAIASAIFRTIYDVNVSGEERIPGDGPLLIATGPHRTAIDVGFPMLAPGLKDRIPETAIVVKENLQDHPLISQFHQIPAYRKKATAERGKPRDIYRLNAQECRLLGIPFDPRNPPAFLEEDQLALLNENFFQPANDWLGAGKTLLISAEGTRFPESAAPDSFDPREYSRLEIAQMFPGASIVAARARAPLLPVYAEVLREKGSLGRRVLAIGIGYPIEAKGGREKKRETEEVRYQLLALQQGLFEDGTFPDYPSFKRFSDWAFERNGGPPSKESETWQPFSERLAEYRQMAEKGP